MMPTAIGYQDLGSFIATRSAVAERWRAHVIASPFGTIHAATFSFRRPLGTAIPPGYALAAYAPEGGATHSLIERMIGEPRYSSPPMVDRALKGDRLIVPQPVLIAPAPPPVFEDIAAPIADQLQAQPETPPDEITTASLPPPTEGAIGLEPPPPPAGPPVTEPETAAADEADERALIWPPVPSSAAVVDVNPAVLTPRLYFGAEPMGSSPGAIVPWGPGEVPTVEGRPETGVRLASLPAPDRGIGEEYADRESGEMIAPKGQVTGPEQRPKSPAEILGLAGKTREKAEKCLAEAVYFEARGEPVRGQIGVAQVVMNRVFHYYYPKTVCEVVYQNKHRHLACQFTFACDNVPDVVTEPDAWARAKVIAKDTLDGKLWVAEIGKATHYHAYWVRPSWVNEMRRLHKLGVHTFYRPRNWGSGDDQPEWGDVTATMEAVKKL